MSDDDAVWKALADPTRRRLLDLLREEPRSTGRLAAEVEEMSRYGVMKHLGILRDAGLVISERRGRRRIHRLNPLPIHRIYRRWMRPFELRAADRLLGLERHLDSAGSPETADPNEEERR